jgi:hypothetical protein
MQTRALQYLFAPLVHTKQCTVVSNGTSSKCQRNTAFQRNMCFREVPLSRQWSAKQCVYKKAPYWAPIDREVLNVVISTIYRALKYEFGSAKVSSARDLALRSGSSSTSQRYLEKCQLLLFRYSNYVPSVRLYKCTNKHVFG